MTEVFETIIVGAGPGGYVAAIRASQLGMRTAVVERTSALGGRCLNWACIPAKVLLRSADIVEEMGKAKDFGVDAGTPEVNFDVVASRRESVITTLGLGVSTLLKKNKVEVVIGNAVLGSNMQLEVGQRTLTATSALVLATGSIPKGLPGIEIGGRVIGTEEVWSFKKLPKSMAIVGAGASGSEIASAYARLGCRVQLFEYLEHVLPTEEPEIARVVANAFERQGIEVHTSATVSDVQTVEDGVTFRYNGEEGSAEWLVIATGREADVASLSLDRVGVERTAAGLISVDDRLRTSAPNVYAIGDLVAGPALAHKASEEGIIAVETAAGNKVEPLSTGDIPRITFCSPNVASFGLTESAARAKGFEVTVGRVPYSSVGAATVYGDRIGLIKLVGERQYGEILGGHIVGARAPELVQQLVNARDLEGGFADLARIVHGHPTLSEGLQEAARSADGWLIHG